MDRKASASPRQAHSAGSGRTRVRRPRSESAISVRVSIETLGLIDTAASVAGKTRTEFLLESACQHAIDVLLDRRVFLLDDEQHAAFMHALDNPPPPLPQLRELMAKPAPWEI